MLDLTMLLLIFKMVLLEELHMATLLGTRLNMRYMGISSVIFQKQNMELLS